MSEKVKVCEPKNTRTCKWEADSANWRTLVLWQYRSGFNEQLTMRVKSIACSAAKSEIHKIIFIIDASVSVLIKSSTFSERSAVFSIDHVWIGSFPLNSYLLHLRWKELGTFLGVIRLSSFSSLCFIFSIETLSNTFTRFSSICF